MKRKKNKDIFLGTILFISFILWTILIQIIDVQNVGVNWSQVGFATFNRWFHSVTGVNMKLYIITDWLGLVPIFVGLIFGIFGLIQLLKRKSLLKVDVDIIILGIYYVIVLLCYLIFEIYPINYRPILISGIAEASYPSSTTLLVLGVMPTLIFQVKRRVKNVMIKRIIVVATILFSAFMVMGRLISGVHWFTDIIGSIFLSFGLFYFYKAIAEVEK